MRSSYLKFGETSNIKEDLNVSDGNLHIVLFATNCIYCFSDIYKKSDNKIENRNVQTSDEGGGRTEGGTQKKIRGGLFSILSIFIFLHEFIIS